MWRSLLMMNSNRDSPLLFSLVQSYVKLCAFASQPVASAICSFFFRFWSWYNIVVFREVSGYNFQICLPSFFFRGNLFCYRFLLTNSERQVCSRAVRCKIPYYFCGLPFEPHYLTYVGQWLLSLDHPKWFFALFPPKQDSCASGQALVLTVSEQLIH